MEQKVPSSDIQKRPMKVFGTYALAENIHKVNTKNSTAYEIPRGEYPVVGVISDDGQRVTKAGIVFSTSSLKSAERMDIVEMIRPVDIPEMVQRREISIKEKADKTLEFPLAMFMGGDKDLKQSKSQSQVAVKEKSVKMAQSM